MASGNGIEGKADKKKEQENLQVEERKGFDFTVVYNDKEKD